MSITEARLTAAAKHAVAPEDFAGPHGSYPIKDKEHFDLALSMAHFAADPQAVRAKAVTIAKRRGFVAQDYTPAQESVTEATQPNVSHDDTRNAIQRELDAEHLAGKPVDPKREDYYDYRPAPRVSDVFPKHFTFRQGYDDAKHFQRNYAMDADGRAKLGAESHPVFKKAVYVPADASMATTEANTPDGETLFLMDYIAPATLAEAGSRHSAADQQHIADIGAHLGQAKSHIDSATTHVTGLGMEPNQGIYAPTYGMGTLIASDDSDAAVEESEITESVTGDAVTFRESGMTPIIREASSVAKGQLTLRILQPGFNTSGKRYYPKETIAEADRKKIFVGKMFIDHPTKTEENDLPERSVSKIGAQITETFLEGDGSLWGKATVFNPTLKTMLADMQQAGVLQTAIGVSINATGRVRESTVEGRKTNVVEAFHRGKSVDFVTDPGAGGRVALMESNRDGDAEPIMESQGENSVTPEQIEQLQKDMRTLLEANQALATRVEESDKARNEAETRANVAVQVQTRLAGIAEGDLPAFAKARVQAVMEGALTIERLEEAITRETEYVKQVRATATATKGVTGLGGNANRISEASRDAMAPSVEAARAELLESGGRLFGGADKFDALMKHVGVI